MKKSLTISEIAQLLNVSTPTLRFWEEKGLFKIAKSANSYRQYTFGDLIRIADIIFYRNLGLPIGKLKDFDHLSLEEYSATLEDSRTKLEAQIQAYNIMYNRIILKKYALREIAALKKAEKGFDYDDIPFETVVKFDYTEKDKILQYTKDTSLYVKYFDTEDMSSETRGIITDLPATKDEILWQKGVMSSYATFLIKEKVDENYLSDVEESLAKVKKFHKTGALLARYLLTATEDGERTDYLKAYVEILK